MRKTAQKNIFNFLLPGLYLLTFIIVLGNHNHSFSWEHRDACPVSIFLYSSNSDTFVSSEYPYEALKCLLILREKLSVFQDPLYELNDIQPRAPPA